MDATSTLAELLSDPGSWRDRDAVVRAVVAELAVDATTAGTIADTLADRGERSAAQAVETTAAERRLRRATELNDTVVQGLAAAVYALELDDRPRLERYLRQTLATASHVATELVVDDVDERGTVHALVRSVPASLTTRDVG
jgi:hypothetical protein